MRMFVKLLCMALIGLGSAFADNVKLYFHSNGGVLYVSSDRLFSMRYSADGTKTDKIPDSHINVMVIDPEKDASAQMGVRLERPVFVLDGIYLSTDEIRTLDDFYKEAQEFGLPEMLSSLGYTPVLVQFTETVRRSVMDNSLLFSALLDFFNHSKQVTFPNAANDGYVVFGISQGGIIGRYGAYLYDLNRSSSDAPIRMYASLDSPHQGAVMPKSLLETIRFWAQEGGAAAAEAFYDLINAPGASDLLLRQSSTKNEANTDTSRFLFGEYRKACEYKGFPTVLVAQGQMKGVTPSHSENLMALSREATALGRTFGNAISRMYSPAKAGGQVSRNYLYEFPVTRKSVNGYGNADLDFIQGSTYPFVRTMYDALRDGILSEMPDDFSVDLSLLSMDLKSEWNEDSLMEPSSTFIPTVSAMDLKCNGNLAIREGCAYTASATGFPFESPGTKSSGDKVYAVDPTHPRYAAPISGRHIQSPVLSDGSVDTLVLRGMQMDIWRVLCELAKVDYDTTSGEFRNPYLSGIFSPKTSCMDASKIPDVVKNGGLLKKSAFPYARFDFNESATEKDAEVSFALPAGWQKVALYDYGSDIPANAVFEVKIKVENRKANWMKAELMLQRTKGGYGVQLNEVDVVQDGDYQVVRWQMPSSEGALTNYHWVRLILNSAGGNVTLSSPKFVLSALNMRDTPNEIKSAEIYPSMYKLVPWSSDVGVGDYSDKMGSGISFEIKNRYDGAYWDIGAVSLGKYSSLEVTYWPGTCQKTRLYFDSKVVRDANLANGNAENGFVVKKLQLIDVVDTEMSPSADFDVSRLNLQGMAAGERCIVKSVKLR